MKNNWHGFLIVLILAWTTQYAISQTQRIQPYASNRYYWQYKNQPVMLLGGSVEDNLFQIPNLKAHLDEIKAAGGNYVRNTMSDRNFAGFEIKAHALVNGKYDLNQWNTAYWQRFSDFLKWTNERDIIVQIEVWDRFDFYREPWNQSQYNPKNNVNYSTSESGLTTAYPDHPNANTNPFFESVPSMRNSTTLLQYQQKFVDKMLSYTLQYNHVLYCMDNETSTDARWGAYWAEYIKAKAKAAGKSVETTEMWDDWDIKSSQHKRTLDHPEIYSFCDLSQNNQNTNQTHWDNLQWARDYLAGNKRPINNVKTYGSTAAYYGTENDAIERFWRSLIGGVAAIRFHRPEGGIGLSETAKKSLKAARNLTALVNPWEMTPHNNLLSSRSTDEAYCSALPGEAYALYFTNGGQVGLNLSSHQGTFNIHWINIATGDVSSPAVVTGGRIVTVTAPASGHWAAAVVLIDAPLTACFTMNTSSGFAPLAVAFDGGCSLAPRDGSITSWQWDFGDGQKASGVTASHTFQRAGTFTVTLTVTDDRNHQATASQTVSVAQIGVFSPVAYFGDASNYSPRTGNRWEVTSDEGDLRYALNTTNYQSPGGDRLGEYSLIKNRSYAGDFTFTCKVRSTDNLNQNKWADIALVFAWQNDQNYCYASLSSQPAKSEATGFYKIVNGRRSEVKWSGRGITDNAYHTIILERSGQIVTLKRDGQTLCSASDAAFAVTGQIGVGSYNDGACFDDMEVTAASNPPAPTVPNPPSHLTATVQSTSSIRIAWTDQSDNETGFRIERKQDGGAFAQIATVSANQTLFTDTGLLASTLYTYRVRSANTAGVSAYSNEASAETNSPPVVTSAVFSPVEYFGDAQNYLPRNASRWEVKEDGGNARYGIKTTHYNSPGGDRLGEYSLIKDRTWPGDFTMTVEMKSTENLSSNTWSDAALVFAYQDDNNYCYASLSSQPENQGATGLYKIVNGQRFTIHCQGRGITDNHYHTILLTRNGATISLIRDGKTLCSATDNAFAAAGNLGVGSYNDGVLFDNIDISDTTEPPLPNDLIAYWPFNETSGTTAHDPANGYNGTLINGAGFTTGKNGNAVNLDGVDDRIDVPTFDITGSGGLTIAAWIKADDFEVNDARIISKATGTDTQDHVWMLSTIEQNGIKLRFRLRTNGTTANLIANSGTLTAGTWMHVAATWDGQTMKLWLNGTQVGSLGKSGSINAAPSVPIAIGNQPAGAGDRAFDGRIDELAIWNRALLQSEIQAFVNGDWIQKNLEEEEKESNLEALPELFMLYQNYPNPFNPETQITYYLAEDALVSFEVLDLRGRTVYRINSGYQVAGFHRTLWNGKNSYNQSLPSGCYIYRIEARNSSQTWIESKRMILLK